LTEIPEHLLKRAAAARAAKSGEEAPADAPAAAAGDAAPAAAAPAAAVEKQAAAPAPLPTLDDEAPKEQPLSPVVAAAMRRKRVPYWAATVLALLPLWGVVYVASVQPPPAGDNDPLVLGKEAYTANQCSGCHGTNGEGGTGAVLRDGEVIKTFADPLAMAYWIHYGAAGGGARPDGTYGDLSREGGPHTLDTIPGSAMPGFPDLEPMEMAELIIYIREGLSGADPAEDPNFNSEVFAADAEALAAMIEEVVALPEGDPDAVATVEGAETE
jgi:mono/diheme cytochrome c family protein